MIKALILILDREPFKRSPSSNPVLIIKALTLNQTEGSILGLNFVHEE